MWVGVLWVHGPTATGPSLPRTSRPTTRYPLAHNDSACSIPDDLVLDPTPPVPPPRRPTSPTRLGSLCVLEPRSVWRYKQSEPLAFGCGVLAKDFLRTELVSRCSFHIPFPPLAPTSKIDRGPQANPPDLQDCQRIRVIRCQRPWAVTAEEAAQCWLLRLAVFGSEWLEFVDSLEGLGDLPVGPRSIFEVGAKGESGI